MICIAAFSDNEHRIVTACSCGRTGACAAFLHRARHGGDQTVNVGTIDRILSFHSEAPSPFFSLLNVLRTNRLADLAKGRKDAVCEKILFRYTGAGKGLKKRIA